jgi:ribonuclease E
VAEVTSLGLIQMTRKKLGLGLLESFSEPCEVCAGRGVIVRHDPTTKHRQTAQPEPRRRGKGGNGGGNGDSGRGSGGSAQQKNGGTHAITDDVKNALAQIAASTIPHSPDSTLPDSTLPDATPEAVEKTADVVSAPVESAPPASRKPATDKPDAETAVQTEPTPAETAEVPIAILDIPVKKGSRSNARRISAHDAEQILDSVLEALPEPKQPGQGRSRVSRRASSQGTVTTHSDGTAS